jgi:hypothetical protein
MEMNTEAVDAISFSLVNDKEVHIRTSAFGYLRSLKGTRGAKDKLAQAVRTEKDNSLKSAMESHLRRLARESDIE